MQKPDFKARHFARRVALQALYSLQMSENVPQDVENHYLNSKEGKTIDVDYFKQIFNHVVKNGDELDMLFAPYTDIPLQELDPIELIILRIATFELSERPDVPFKVILNEWLELAKSFGGTDGHKFINGILDKVAKQLRTEAS